MNNHLKVTLLCFIIIGTITEAYDLRECIPRNFGHSSFACVCNATYCDTLPSTLTPPKGEFVMYTSDMKSLRFSKTKGSFERHGTLDEVKKTKTEEFSLYHETKLQSVIGFGGAFTDAATKNILSLSHDAQENLLRSYFSEDGIEYNMGRVNMGGCDFSWRTYSYDDVEGDTKLVHFELQEEDTKYKIPVIRRAMSMSKKPIKLVASPWSAPVWMKSNDEFKGRGHLLKKMYQPWANYFVKFFQEYHNHSVDFWGMTAQNEPINGNIPKFIFNCMGWTAETQRKWIAENLGPTLEENGLGDLKLMILDDQRFLLPDWAETVLEDPEASKYVDGIAVHWYWDDVILPTVLERTQEAYPDKFVLGTEACIGDKPYETSVAIGKWERLERYATDIITYLKYRVSGWMDWNLALDTQGGPNWAENYVDSPIIVNEAEDEFYKNPMFYAMGHFSKFSQSGAHVITLQDMQEATALEAIAIRNPDDTVAIVILNKSEMEIEAKIHAYEHQFILPLEHDVISVVIGPRSLNTIYYRM